MKKLILVSLGFCLASFLPAQGPADNPPAAKRTTSELNELLGPIALYPDALIALILPASTVPADVVLGARYVATNGNPANVDDKNWDSSVKALTRYPDTLKWLDENLEWTAQVGDAFIEQPVEVMESIQQLRAKAKALGNLRDTPQQRIVQDDTYIRIIPTQPNYIYEPRYDSDVIYSDRPDSGQPMFFGAGYGTGSWLDSDWDWRRHRLYRGEWHEGWDYDHDHNSRGREDYPYINNRLTNSHEWHPDTDRHHAQSRQIVERHSTNENRSDRTQSSSQGGNDSQGHHSGIIHPKAITNAPHHHENNTHSQPGDGDRGMKEPSDRTGHDTKSGDNSRGHTPTPKTQAPGLTGDGKKRNDSSHEHADHKKPDNEPPPMTHHTDTPSKKEVEHGPHVAEPRHEEPRHNETPKHIEQPNHEESKHREAPKHEEPKHNDAPKHEQPTHEESKHKEAPKHEEPQKHQDVKKPDAPHHEAEKPKADSDKPKGKGHDKKKDDDKKE